MPERILDFFPLPYLPPRNLIDSDLELTLERLKSVQKERAFTPSVNMDDDDDETVNRPGGFYKRYAMSTVTIFLLRKALSCLSSCNNQKQLYLELDQPGSSCLNFIGLLFS